jgi:hypothetical protein
MGVERREHQLIQKDSYAQNKLIIIRWPHICEVSSCLKFLFQDFLDLIE